MNQEINKQRIRTQIWQEEPESDNAFATRVARCHGFDVYGDMLGRARWVEMLYLLFRGEIPSVAASHVLETLAVALANPGPRDASVHAAMCGGTAGSPAAASLIAALAVGAGQLFGGREVLLAVRDWNDCGTDLDAWHKRLSARPAPADVTAWPAPEHPPGFDPHGVTTTLVVTQTLSHLADRCPGPIIPWLATQRSELESIAGLPLSLTGIAAAAFADIGFTPEQAEMLHLMLRLPGAAAHALEQQELGHKKFPFYENEFETSRADHNQEIEA